MFRNCHGFTASLSVVALRLRLHALSCSAWLGGAARVPTPTTPRPRSWDDEDEGEVEKDGSDDDENGHTFAIVSCYLRHGFTVNGLTFAWGSRVVALRFGSRVVSRSKTYVGYNFQVCL